MDSIGFYEDDEGICCDVLLRTFGFEPIQIINLEHYELDEKFKEDVRFIYYNQKNIHQKITPNVIEYIQKKYQSENHSFELMKIYTSHDVKREFGFLFSWIGDQEHGIGVKLNCNGDIIKIGSAETAFI